MTDTNNNEKRSRGPLVFAIILIVVLVLGWHLILPLFGIAIATTAVAGAMTAGAWGMVIATIAILCVCALLLFLIPGFVMFLIGLFALIWVLMAIVLFPFLFPLLVPLLIIVWAIVYIRRRKNSDA